MTVDCNVGGPSPALSKVLASLLDSQTGPYDPYASRAFTAIPYTTEVTYPDHIFRILMLRRLRLPLPLTERACRCRRTLDSLGDHRAACGRAGVFRSRGVPLEHAAARVCHLNMRPRGFAGKLAFVLRCTCTRLANLNVRAVQRVDDRTIEVIEVIATGLPLWHASQLAIDTTLVSPLTGAAQPWRRGGQYAGAALHTAQMPACCPGHGGWRPLEPGSSNFPPAPRPNQSPGNTRTFAAHRGGFSHRTMVSHPYTRRYASVRSIPAQPVSRQRSQWRWCPPTPSGNSSPKHHPPPLPPVDFQNRRFFSFHLHPPEPQSQLPAAPLEPPILAQGWSRSVRASPSCVWILPSLFPA